MEPPKIYGAPNQRYNRAMAELLHALLCILFPLDPVARIRELTRDYIRWLIAPLSDPRAIPHLHASPAARRELLSHIAVIEQGMNLLIHHRARQLLGHPFQHHDAEHRHPVRDKSVDAIVARLTRLLALFDNLDRLAARRAQRHPLSLRASSPLRLDATHRSTSPGFAGGGPTTHTALEVLHRRRRGRWIARSRAQDGGGCASSRGPPLINSIAYCRLPTASVATRRRPLPHARLPPPPFSPPHPMLLSPDSTRGRRAVTRKLLGIAAVAALLTLPACGRPSDATTPAAAAAKPAPAATLVPDAEADVIPTANGIPLVPLTAEVNFLDALEPQASYKLPAEYNTNHTAVQIIKEEETLQLEAYELGGLWLIGYGHLMLEGEDDVITEEQADAFLVEDLHWCEGSIERYVTIPVTLNEFSAMVAFCYNVGSGKTRGSSIVKRINDEDRPGAANAFLLWNRMNGVVMQALAKRRARERTLFLTP